MSLFKNYVKKAVQPMRPYIVGENMENISVGEGITPTEGGMIAVDPNNSEDMWYIAPEYMEAHYTEIGE